MLDNAIDFLWKNYKGAEDTSISVDIHKDDNLFKVKIRNTNHNNVSIFKDLESTFNFDMRYGSKQDVHIISRGMLGDAMKQILSLGYVLLHTSDDGTSFIDNQWEYPLIIRHNKKERKVYLIVNNAEQENHVRIDDSPEELDNVDTEIELVLPVIDEVHDSLTRDYIEQFCRKYSLFTTDISFKFRIIDDSTYPEAELNDKKVDDVLDIFSDNRNVDDILAEKLTSALATVPSKGILNIDIPALHPIATEWNNADFIHSYRPDEFKSRIVNVHDRDSTLVYDVLLTFREGSHIIKTPSNQLTISELLAKPVTNFPKTIEHFYRELRKVFDAPAELSLPYTTNQKKRMFQLVERLTKIYPEIDREMEPSYRLVRGFYDNGLIQYPFAFEILAIPIKEPYGPTGRNKRPKPHQFLGAVNYSVSPKNNIFEGEYFTSAGPVDIIGVLRVNEFQEHGAPHHKLPCIIVGNLVTPRRDPHGYDKSSIDIKPFAKTIITTVQKMSKGVRTYRAEGWKFGGKESKDASKTDTNKRGMGRATLIKFMQDEFGLPTTDKYGREMK